MSELIREQYLTDLFRKYDAECSIVRVTFSFGECFDLRIGSTMHAEAGGDIVASVVRCIHCAYPDRWKSSLMNFKLENVVQVEVEGERVFDIHSTGE